MLVGHYVIKLFLWNKSIAVLVSLLYHLLELVFIDVLTEVTHHSLQSFQRDVAWFLVIKQVKYLSEIFFCVLIWHSGCHQIQEFGKVQLISSFFQDILDHEIKGLINGLLAKCIKTFMKIFIDEKVPLQRKMPFRCESKRSKTSLIYLTSSEETPGLSYSVYLKDELASLELPWTLEPVVPLLIR